MEKSISSKLVHTHGKAQKAWNLTKWHTIFFDKAWKPWKLRDTHNLEHKKKNTHNTCFTPSFFVINAILKAFCWWEGSSPSLHEFSTQCKESFNLYAPCLKRRKTRIILCRSLSKIHHLSSLPRTLLAKDNSLHKATKNFNKILGVKLIWPQYQWKNKFHLT